MSGLKRFSESGIISLLMVVVLSLGISHKIYAAEGWIYETVYMDGKYPIQTTSIAVDSNNGVHIVSGPTIPLYCLSTSEVMSCSSTYSTNASGQWSTSYKGDYDPSLALDSNNNVHIVYSEDVIANMGHGLRYESNSTGTWASERVQSGGIDGSIALDSNHKVHIAYISESRKYLQYATNANGIWEISTIDTELADIEYENRLTGPSIAIDNAGKVHIVYVNDNTNELKYATNAPGYWSIAALDTVGNDTGSWSNITDIAIDSNDNVHIVYFDDSYLSHFGIKYASNMIGDWVITTVTNNGFYPALAIDKNKKAHITYDTPLSLQYATNISGKWNYSIIEMLSGDILSDIAVDRNGKVHVSYYTSTALKHATIIEIPVPPQCSEPVPIPISTTAMDQKGPIMAFDQNNNVFFSVWTDFRNCSSGETNCEDIYGSLSGNSIAISTAAKSQRWPVIAFDSKSNRFLIAWNDLRNGSVDIYGQLIKTDGGLYGDNFAISVSSGAVSSIAFDPKTNQYLIVKHDKFDTATGLDIYAQLINADGSPAGNEFPISTVSGDQITPKAAFDKNNNRFLIVWLDKRNLSASGSDIYGQLIDSNGGLYGSEFLISPAPNEQGVPGVTFDPTNNRFLVVWHDYRSSSYSDIYGQIVDSNGNLYGNNFAISSAISHQKYPSVAFDSHNNLYIVIWQDHRLTTEDVYGQWIDPNGTLIGDSFCITTAAGYQQFPKVSFNSKENNFLVVWQDWRNNSTKFDIYGAYVSYVSGIVISETSSGSNGGSGGGGCFIATAAYGSSLHPHIKVLKDFRDRYLLTNVPGRIFVTIYYKVSPLVADFIRKHEILRTTARIVLIPVVYGIKYPGITFIIMFLGIFVITGKMLLSSGKNGNS